jgi:hypothetical protein
MRMARQRRSSGLPNEYQVFVCHATADKWIATQICQRIEAAGAKTFRDDRDIDGGDDIPETLRAEIRRSRELVVLLTPDSIERAWVLTEVGAAWGMRKDYRIVPVLCHVTTELEPALLSRNRAVSINAFDDYLSALTKRVRSHR